VSTVATTPVSRPSPSPLDRWAEVYGRVGDLRAVAVLRVVLGPVVLLHLWPFLQDARDGVSYDDHFWHPYASWMPQPSAGLWQAMLWAGVGAAVLMSLGLLTRLATATAFAVVAGNLLLSTTHFGHNRTFLAILLGGMALLPVGHQLSVDAWWRRNRGRAYATAVSPLWPLMLLRVQVSLVYLASGTSKLIDPDWFGGLVLWDRVVRNQHHLEPTPLPGWSIDLLTWRPLFYVVAPVVVLSELFVGLGLWGRRTRLAALWVAVLFHVSIEVTASVEVFSLAGIAALAIWVTPVTRDRTLVVPYGARVLPTIVRALDWFARFRIVEAEPDQRTVAVVDRDGTTLTGRAAGCLVLSRLPLTFPLLPVLALVGRRRTTES
jgi:vitamin K-dependent gamma-carboxylase-like protein